MRHWRLALASLVLFAVRPAGSFAQTLVQLSDMGSQIGPRLTQSVAIQKLGVSLFGSIGGKVTYVVGDGNPPTAYEFATDPWWNRILFGQKDQYVNAFRNDPNGGLSGPLGLDVSAQGTVFVADALNARVLLLHFDPGTKALSYVAEISSPEFLGLPLDVAWDGGTWPLSANDPVFYVISSQSRLSSWTYYNSMMWEHWAYGSRGSGQDQFLDPRGVCVGHALGWYGGSTFTMDLYVADAGNHRVVRLQRGSSGQPSWVSSVTLPNGGIPTDCSVDHFGNVYVVDQLNCRILKYTYQLEGLVNYGSCGRGATNYNTFSAPNAIHVVFGRRTSGGVSVYYGEGRILTAEEWTENSGALEHWLGVDAIDVGTPMGSFGAWGYYTATDHAYTTIEVIRDLGYGTVQYVAFGDFRPPGFQNIYWDGSLGDGSAAPADWYRFRINLVSGYGCDGSAWCQKTVVTDRFYARGRDCNLVVCPIERNVGLVSGGTETSGPPVDFYLHQLVTPYVGPLARRSEVLASVAVFDPTVSMPGVLSAQVRAHGLTALALGVPASPSPVQVVVRIYSLNGALVRELTREAVDPGEYVVGWDGKDRDGRPVPPGVYIAVMNAGGFQGTQRLIVPRQ